MFGARDGSLGPQPCALRKKGEVLGLRLPSEVMYIRMSQKDE